MWTSSLRIHESFLESTMSTIPLLRGTNVDVSPVCLAMLYMIASLDFSGTCMIAASRREFMFDYGLQGRVSDRSVEFSYVSSVPEVFFSPKITSGHVPYNIALLRLDIAHPSISPSSPDCSLASSSFSDSSIIASAISSSSPR